MVNDGKGHPGGQGNATEAKASGIAPSERAVRAPSKAVLRFAPKAVLTPDELSRLQQHRDREDEERLLVHSVLGDEVPPHRLTDAAMYLPVTTDRYLPGLHAVAGGADPDASIVAVERGS